MGKRATGAVGGIEAGQNGAAPMDAKPMNEYVIAVIGFPKTGFEPRNGSSDPNGPIDDAQLVS